MKKTILFLIVTFIFNYAAFSQGKIEKAEDSLKKIEILESHNESQTLYSGVVENSDNSFLTEVVGGLFISIFTYTAYGIAIESPFEMHRKASGAFLTKYPYNNSDVGNYSYNWNEDTEIFTTSISNRFIFETNRIYGNHLNVEMRFLKRMAIEFDYLQLWEENKNFGNNSLAIYTALAQYHRVRTEKFDAWWGLGAAYIDGDVNKLGFTYGLGAELFFAKPLSFESNFNQILINKNTINKFNILLNYHKKEYKFSSGYEYLKIGDVGFSTVSAGAGITF